MSKDPKLKKNIQIGPYKILMCIGTGGMGEVYKAHEETLNRYVALKFITRALEENKTVLKRLEIEGKTLAQISHPNIVTIYGRGVHEGRHYLAMEYVSGIPLEKVYEKKLPLKLIVNIFEQLLSALKVLHSNKIIHRDIKPNNIIIKNDYDVKLIDFGIANMSDPESRFEITNNGEIVGSIKYLAPEVIDGAPITELSDIRSLGLVIYQLITGKYPYDITDKFVLADQIRSKVLSFKNTGRSVPKDLQDIVLKMVAIDPNRRYKTIAQVITDLADFKKGTVKINTSSRSFQLPKVESKTRLKPIAMGLTVASIIFAGYLYKNSLSINESSSASIAPPAAYQPPSPESSGYQLNDEDLQKKREQDSEAATIPESQTSVTPNANTRKLKPTQPVFKARSKSVAIKAPKRRKLEKLSKPRVDIKEQTVTINFSNDRSPASNATAKLRWSRDRKAKKYEVIISKDVKFRSNVLKKNLKSSSFNWSPSAPGQYYWIVRSISNKSKSPYSKPSRIKILIPEPALNFSAENKLPANKSNFKLPVTWKPIKGANSYKVEISQSAKFNRIHSKKTTKATSTSFSLSPGKYYLRSVSLDRSGQAISRYRRPAAVNIKKGVATLQAPNLFAPKNQQSFKESKLDYLEFSWSEHKGAMGYEIQLSKNKNFSKILSEKKVSLPLFMVKNPNFKGKIFWRVRTLKQSQTSSWSSANSIIIKN